MMEVTQKIRTLLMTDKALKYVSEHAEIESRTDYEDNDVFRSTWIDITPNNQETIEKPLMKAILELAGDYELILYLNHHVLKKSYFSIKIPINRKKGE